MAGKKDKVKDKDRFSILSDTLDRCYLCGSSDRLALHEAFGGTANRKKSKEDGLIFPLCGPHHNLGTFSVHNNKDLDLKLKRYAEKIWLIKYTHEDLPIEDRIQKFIDRYGKNYLEENDLWTNGRN